MANPDHLAVLREGAEVWNSWKNKNPDIRPDLSRAELTWTFLNGADLTGADLSNANLSRARLRQAYLSGANLVEADLHQADLVLTDLSRANLSRANVSEAGLIGANLVSANLSETVLVRANLNAADLRLAHLSGTDLNWAKFGFTVLAHVDLSSTKGLETVTHSGPSTIGIDTVYRSGGKIPEVFLRGCGVPDKFIAYIGSLVGKPIEFYSCFISYSSKDQEFAERLHADLQAKGVRCWFAPHHIAAGKKIHEQIDEAIRLHERLLLILSPASMESEWVKTEIAKARKREVREKRRVLFPVRLVDFETLRDWECFDAETGKDSAREIREYFIPDFGHWKDHESYQRAFERLLRDLKAEAPTK